MSEAIENSRFRYAKPAWLRTSVLCRRDDPITGNWRAIGWWESRRIPYNLIVGSAGVLCCLLFGIMALEGHFFFQGDWPFPGSPGLAYLAILLYGVIANLFFTGGWIAEILVRKLWPQEADRFATLSFSLGLQVSVLLTLAPAIIFGAATIIMLVAHLFGVVPQKPAPPFY